MTQQTREIVESKAKELYELLGYVDYEIRKDVHEYWKKLARHVLASEIRAKIEQVKEDRLENWDITPQVLNEGKYGFIKGAKSVIAAHQAWCEIRIKELEKQLSELESL